MVFKTALRLFFVLSLVIAANSCSKAYALPGQDKPVLLPPLEEPTPIENFLSGQVVKVTTGAIVIKQQDRGNIVLRLLPTTDVWSGLWVKSIPVTIGDRIDARVERRSDGVFDAQKVWVNIVSLEGNISRVEKKADGFQFSLQNQFVGFVVMNIDPRTEVILQGKKDTFGNSPVELREGQLVRIIGRRLRDGSVIVTKLIK